MSVPTNTQRADLLTALQGVEKTIRSDLLAQYRADERLMVRARERLADEENSPSDVEAWLQTFAGRGAVLYILKTLYVRVLEDQGLLHPTRIRAGGSYELFQRLFPNLGVAVYLRRIFEDAARVFPELFAPTAVEIATPGEASARELWSVWQAAAPGGSPRFDFRRELDTRFIGDLYQDLDPDVKKRYALLQTPRFIEEFILDRTLDPALQRFGLDGFRVIDPTCGSGHFLLGAFERLARAWRARLGDSSEARWEASIRAIAAVHGADLNEYACALSRFRLLLAVVRETGVTDAERLRELHFNVITCDSLIPWEQIVDRPLPGMASYSWLADYGIDEERACNEDFFSRGFHAVVGNPPYINVRDEKKRLEYRKLWPRSAQGIYSLSAPMTERFVTLPVDGGSAGFIVANSFIKANFGKGTIENVLSSVALDLIVDLSRLTIPGHGTPTLMLFATNVRTQDAADRQTVVIAGKRGEISVEAESSDAWRSISTHWSDIGYEDIWISVQSEDRSDLIRHPWSFGSRVQLEIQHLLETHPSLASLGADAGFAAIVAQDEAFIRRRAEGLPTRPVVFGENIRDWRIEPSDTRMLVPSDSIDDSARELAANIDLWHLRTTLWERQDFDGRTYRENRERRVWWQFRQIVSERLNGPDLRIAFPEQTTTAHFVVTQSNTMLFLQNSPLLSLPGSEETVIRDVAALLNTSTMDFWFKQVCRDRGNGGVNGGVAAEDWEKFYIRKSTTVIQAPYTTEGKGRRLALVSALERQRTALTNLEPVAVLKGAVDFSNLFALLEDARIQWEQTRNFMVALQEELDWVVYEDFGISKGLPLCPLSELRPLELGHRPFEIALAREVERNEGTTAWFARHAVTPVTDIPAPYLGQMRDVLEKRLALIENDALLALLEKPVYKRRWQTDTWDARVKRAAELWILDRVEVMLRESPQMLTVDELVDALGSDPAVIALMALAKIDTEVTLSDSLSRLLRTEAISDNPARLFTVSGLAKYVGLQTACVGPSRGIPDTKPFQPGEHIDWKRVWRLQEREDAGDALTVAAAPRFVRADYAVANGWKLRDAFNVSNERFVAYDELSPVRYAWAGWTIAERATLSLQAFELRGREPDDAPVKPDEIAPQRCGIQFALWDKIDELRRTGDPLQEEVQTIAQLCGRACPCDVVHEWRRLPEVRGNGRARPRAVAAIEPRSGASLRQREVDTDAVERLLALLRSSGDAGSRISELEPLFSGNREAALNTLEILRSDGRVEAVGKGRGVRYRLPQAGLFSS